MFAMRKSISTAVLMIGAALLGISSCATVPNKPLAPGELRLLSVLIPEKEKENRIKERGF